MARGRSEDPRHYLERWGLLFEQLGATRMAGRLLGWLLICDPPEQTAKQIALATGTSAASVSTTTRHLLQAAMIERVGVPGQRSACFRVRTGAWAHLMRVRLERLAEMAYLAEEGFSLLPAANGKAGLRLRETASCVTFVEKEFPALLERWERRWRRGQR